MKYLGIMFMTVILTIVACDEQDPDSVIIVGPDRPIDAGCDGLGEGGYLS